MTFIEMMEKYSKQYEVDMSDYLWYFHANEEGSNLGGFFYEPPNKRVKRIPVTPKMLSDFIETKRWKIDYPKHTFPDKRPDLLINQFVIIALVVGIILWALLKSFS